MLDTLLEINFYYTLNLKYFYDFLSNISNISPLKVFFLIGTKSLILTNFFIGSFNQLKFLLDVMC